MRCGRAAPPSSCSFGALWSQSSPGGAGGWHSHWAHVKLALTSSALPSWRVTVTIHSTPMVCSWNVGPNSPRPSVSATPTRRRPRPP